MKKLLNNSNTLTFLTVAYVTTSILATITAVKVINIFGFSATGGTLIFPLTFIFKDFIQKKFGRKVAKFAIWTAGLMTILTFVSFLLIGAYPADTSWTNQEAWDLILTPVWRIAVASVFAMVFSELFDTFVFSKIYSDKRQVLASAISNIIGTIADSFIFVVIAFYGVLPGFVLIDILIAQIIVKLLMTLFASPSILFVKRSVDLKDV